MVPFELYNLLAYCIGVTDEPTLGNYVTDINVNDMVNIFENYHMLVLDAEYINMQKLINDLQLLSNYLYICILVYIIHTVIY